MKRIHRLMPASKWKLVISGFGVFALLVFSGFVLFEATKAEVVVTDNGKEQTLSTHAKTVEGLLAEIGIEVGEHDQVTPGLSAAVENGMTIDYRTAMQLTVEIDGEQTEYFTTLKTVEEFLAAEGLSFSERDDVSHNASEEVKDGLHIEVNTAYEITIDDGGKEKKHWTTGGTVQQILAQANVSYDSKSDDRVSPSLDKAIAKGGNIAITRVEKQKEEVTAPIAFETEKREDASLLKGKETVLSEGKEGTLKEIYEITMENGKEVSRELVDKKVTDSVNRVVAVGTKEAEQPKVEPAVTTLSSKQDNNNSSKPAAKTAGSSKGGESITMTASAFTAECDGCSGITATGLNLKANPNMKVIAVDPSVIPLGTKVWVEGYGEAIAGDTGGHIKGNRIDIHVPTKSDAYNWGVKTVQVKILN